MPCELKKAKEKQILHFSSYVESWGQRGDSNVYTLEYKETINENKRKGERTKKENRENVLKHVICMHKTCFFLQGLRANAFVFKERE